MTINSINTRLSQIQKDLRKGTPIQRVCFGALVTSVALGALSIYNRSIVGLGASLGISYLSYNTFQVITNLNNPSNRITFSIAIPSDKYPIEKLKEDGYSTQPNSSYLTKRERTSITYKDLEKNTIFFDFGVSFLFSQKSVIARDPRA